MSLTIVNWPLLITLVVLSAVAIFRRSRSSAARNLSLASRKERLKAKQRGTGAPDLGLRLVAPAAVFLGIAAVGATSLYLGEPRPKVGATEAGSPGSDPDREMLASLSDYAQSVGADVPASKPAAGEMLPDVDTMIERLATRLRSAPGDVNGWRMLGWSYFNTGHYGEAASAYAKALELAPGSGELKLAYEEAKAKAANAQ